MPYVFGYGSLAARPPGEAPPQIAHLNGFQRVWNVAMDNSENLPGYKYYRHASDGSRPAVFVSFLNLAPLAGAAVNGVLLPVDDSRLQALDRRERNYERRDITFALGGAGGETVWAYIGTAAAEARFRAGAAVVSREYVDAVEAAFLLLGPAELAQFRASTAPLSCPVVELERVDLPTD